MALNRGIYIITGIMASGKSTISQMLAEQFDKGVHVHGDMFRKMTVKGSVGMTPEETLRGIISRAEAEARIV